MIWETAYAIMDGHCNKALFFFLLFIIIIAITINITSMTITIIMITIVHLTRPRRVGANRLPWCRHICLPIITGREVRNLWGGQCVSSWWPLVWLWYLHQLCSFIWFVFRCLKDGVCDLYKNALLMGKGWSKVACPFQRLVVLSRMLDVLT